MIELLIPLVITIALLAMGLLVGRNREARHLRALAEVEEQHRDVLLTDLRTVPDGIDVAAAELVVGEVVIATDYWKTFSANIRKLFGGEVRSLGTLMGRARREAQARMIRQARQRGAELVINVRIETSEIGGRMPITEVVAYGTAITPAR